MQGIAARIHESPQPQPKDLPAAKKPEKAPKKGGQADRAVAGEQGKQGREIVNFRM
jgi:hypothetical protein